MERKQSRAWTVGQPKAASPRQYFVFMITHGSEKKLDDDDDDNDDGDDDGDDNDDSGDDADDGDSGDNNAWACLVVQESEALLQIL